MHLTLMNREACMPALVTPLAGALKALAFSWEAVLLPRGQHASRAPAQRGPSLANADYMPVAAPAPAAAGMDSILWRKVNCRGRAVFLENWQEWIEKITAIDPALEVYKVDYNTSVGAADDWFNGGRWSLDVPVAVSNDCYDVILVDAPQGFKDSMPGG